MTIDDGDIYISFLNVSVNRICDIFHLVSINTYCVALVISFCSRDKTKKKNLFVSKVFSTARS